MDLVNKLELLIANDLIELQILYLITVYLQSILNIETSTDILAVEKANIALQKLDNFCLKFPALKPVLTEVLFN